MHLNANARRDAQWTSRASLRPHALYLPRPSVSCLAPRSGFACYVSECGSSIDIRFFCIYMYNSELPPSPPCHHPAPLESRSKSPRLSSSLPRRPRLQQRANRRGRRRSPRNASHDFSRREIRAMDRHAPPSPALAGNFRISPAPPSTAAMP